MSFFLCCGSVWWCRRTMIFVYFDICLWQFLNLYMISLNFPRFGVATSSHPCSPFRDRSLALRGWGKTWSGGSFIDLIIWIILWHGHTASFLRMHSSPAYRVHTYVNFDAICALILVSFLTYDSWWAHYDFTALCRMIVWLCHLCLRTSSYDHRWIASTTIGGVSCLLIIAVFATFRLKLPANVNSRLIENLFAGHWPYASGSPIAISL